VPGVIDDAGAVRHVTAVAGLYFLGLPWQTCHCSALLGFVGADAATLSTRTAADARRAPRPGRGAAGVGPHTEPRSTVDLGRFRRTTPGS
jgi:putative flavoprotein involved in K+ transport